MKSCRFAYFIAAVILVGPFSTDALAQISTAISYITTDLSMNYLKSCAIAVANDGSLTDSDAEGDEGFPVDASASASITSASALGWTQFPYPSYLGMASSSAAGDNIDDAAVGKSKTDGYSLVIEEDYQTDFQIDYQFDTQGAESMALFVVSLWQGGTDGEVLQGDLLIQPKDGWTYMNIGNASGDDFYVLATGFVNAGGTWNLSTVWSDINLLAGGSYGVYVGTVSAISSGGNPFDLNPITAGLLIPEPVTLLLFAFGGLMLRKKK